MRGRIAEVVLGCSGHYIDPFSASQFSGSYFSRSEFSGSEFSGSEV